MKQLIGASCATIIVFVLSCNKTFTSHDPGQPPSNQILLRAAQDYVTDSLLPLSKPQSISSVPRKSSAKRPVWSHAEIFPLAQGPAVLVPLSYSQKFYVHSPLDPSNIYDLDSLSRLLIYRDTQGHFHAQTLTIVPDSSYHQRKTFQGIILAEDWNGHRIAEF